MRRAMLAGARDFLSKPPMIDELTNAIRQAGKMAFEEKRKVQVNLATIEAASSSAAGQRALGKIIVVYSPKGGTGCTTIAVNVALGLQSESSPTVLIDASLQFGDVAVFLNEQGRNSILDLTPRADDLDPDIVEEVMIKQKGTGLDVLAAPPRPEYADNISPDQFSKVLSYLQKLYSYIVIDTATYLTDVVQSSLDVANVIILIATQDIPSIKNANLFLGLSDASGINRKRLLFVINRFDKRISISSERIGESLRQPVEAIIPFEDRVVTTSINRGTPFIIENKASILSKSIYTVIDKIKEKITEQHEEETATQTSSRY